MKLASASPPPRRQQRGFFLVIVLLAITAIMLIYLTVDARRLAVLKQDLRRVEQQQIQRLNPAEFGPRPQPRPRHDSPR